jgi:isochorismate synthase
MRPDCLNALDRFIEAGRSFAVYRTPGSRLARFLARDRGPVGLLREIDELNGQSGFVMAPFEVSDSCPLVLLRPDRDELVPLPQSGASTACTAAARTLPAAPDAAYAGRFQTFIAPVREGRFSKLVLSREALRAREAGFSAAGAFLLACNSYTHSYVYLFHTPETGAWMGCTPEILLKGENGRWNTVALAGSRLLRPEALPDGWDDKNRTEQRLVAAYVRAQLRAFGIRPVESGPYTVRAGGLAHLKTGFHFRLPDTARLGDLLKCLHPTPAVSGLPKEEARRFILANEGYARRYYSGFAGWLAPEGTTALYVNLRCMNIRACSLRLYAGGGLLPASVMEDEWLETEYKLQTMLSVAGKPNCQSPEHSIKKA